ncbi:MAG TPA: taurine catabolism dioxygenase TauD [Rhizobiales bacterium]|nr:taurine catabolism dioxygenase TauD [Hyphomicrobiales bacterium]
MQSDKQAENRKKTKRKAGRRPAGPFDLCDNETYRDWRAAKLAASPASVSELVVEISDLATPGEAERAALISLCRKANMAIYTSRPSQTGDGRVRDDLRSFARALGLHRVERHRSAADDGIVAIEVAGDGSRKGYIPYSDRPLSWHTDGYYNGPADRIGALVLHCVREADEGGESGLLDPEIAYIRLRDENPDFIAAFMHAEAMTIPANVEDNGKVRAPSTGPVFAVDPRTGKLNMRYSARGRNIVWRDDPDTLAAVHFLASILANGDRYIFRHKFAPGQGLICNNVLHNRTGFKNPAALSGRGNRLLYRLRYPERIAGTG